MAAHARAGAVLVLLPEEARLLVLAQHRVQHVLAQGRVEALRAGLVDALHLRVVMQCADRQVVNWDPDGASVKSYLKNGTI